MKLFLLCLVVIFAVLEAKAAPSNSQDEDARWETFKIKHAKSYKTSAEHSQRKKNFVKHLAKIDAHNSDPNNSFTLGVNKYADEDNEEFVKTMNGFKEPSSASSLSAVAATIVNPTATAPLPASVDWRTSGAVTPVKDQGQCGSCWSFSSTGSLEGHTFRKTGKLVSLSEQNLVDCNTQNSGCNGGWMDYAFNYIKTNKGIDTAASYPYKAVGGTCKFNAATIGATDTGFVRITPGNETALQIAVATLGPVAVAIDASHNSFQLYSSGVYSETACNPNYLDHAVLVVGYGTYNGKNYWLVKNSWGTSWGMAGYIMMPRNSNNYCGIASHAVYPTV